MKEAGFHTLFAQIRTVFHRIQRIGCVSPSAIHVSVIGALGFVCGLILTLRGVRMGTSYSLPWSSDNEVSSNKIFFVSGLRNLGNNCFLNVILQALASCASFRLFLEENAEELNSECSSYEEHVERLPLTSALTSLFEELCMLHDKRTVLNPRTVMSAMYLYMPQFQLMDQQDAAEAFLHLLTCLRGEFSESYIPNHGSLADLGYMATGNGRIVTQERIEDASYPKKWKKRFIGPFDGVLSSFLTCQSCSSEILLDYDFFHTLSLSPLVDVCDSIVDLCTLEDCLKRFISTERVENYHCTHCWHLAAIKFLSISEGNEEEMRKLRCCSKQDSCDCRNLRCLQGLQWSDRFSRTVKQLSIVCFPKILCLQIQRASVNMFGEHIKKQGHISFPMVLDLSPFVNAGVGIRNTRDDLSGPVKQQSDPSILDFTHLRTVRMLNLISGLSKENKPFEPVDGHKVEGFCDVNLNQTKSHQKVPNRLKAADCGYKYRLVSAVVHFGRSGSGHYTVYRGVETNVATDEDANQVADSPLKWFSISDSLVHPASEEEVLAAEATLLFYEKIMAS